MAHQRMSHGVLLVIKHRLPTFQKVKSSCVFGLWLGMGSFLCSADLHVRLAVEGSVNLQILVTCRKLLRLAGR